MVRNKLCKWWGSFKKTDVEERSYWAAFLCMTLGCILLSVATIRVYAVLGWWNVPLLGMTALHAWAFYNKEEELQKNTKLLGLVLTALTMPTIVANGAWVWTPVLWSLIPFSIAGLLVLLNQSVVPEE